MNLTQYAAFGHNWMYSRLIELGGMSNQISKAGLSFTCLLIQTSALNHGVELFCYKHNFQQTSPCCSFIIVNQSIKWIK